MEPDQINILALTVLRDLQEIDHTEETRLSRQLRGNVRKTDRLDGIHFDLSFFHRVSGAYSDMWTGPDPDTARDFSAPNSLPQPLGEHHQAILDRLRRAYRNVRAPASLVVHLNDTVNLVIGSYQSDSLVDTGSRLSLRLLQLRTRGEHFGPGTYPMRTPECSGSIP